MRKRIVALFAAAVMALSFSITSLAASFELSDSSSYEFKNPFKGKNCTEVVIEYTIKLNDNAAANGWDGIMSFYNPSTLGRVSVQTHPYVCWNSVNEAVGWIDYKADAVYSKKGEEHSFKIVIKAEGIEMYQDGELIPSRMTGSSTTDANNPVEVTYQNVLDAINSYEYFYVGVGAMTYAYWNTERCVLSDVKINGTEFTPDGVNTETTTPMAIPQRNTMDYGAPVDDGGSDFNPTIIIVAVVAVVVVAGVAAAVVAGKKGKKDNAE